ncbi:MAG: hypothetical protein ACYTG2_17960 [Planctomycetota bacterium]|jgi:hypothetical protein
MNETELTRRIEDLKSTTAARRRRRQPVRAPAVLARLDVVEHLADDVAATLRELIDSLPGLALVRCFGCGSRILAASGAEEPRAEGRRIRAAWSRLEFRLRRADDGETLVLSSRSTVCDTDLPTLRIELPASDGEPSVRQARAFVEESALAFARALLSRRADPDVRLDANRLPRGF